MVISGNRSRCSSAQHAQPSRLPDWKFERRTGGWRYFSFNGLFHVIVAGRYEFLDRWKVKFISSRALQTERTNFLIRALKKTYQRENNRLAYRGCSIWLAHQVNKTNCGTRHRDRVLALIFTGPPGRDGLPGPVGPPGVPGLSGSQGLQGVAGPQGINGVSGVPGTQGPPGVPGLQGSKTTLILNLDHYNLCRWNG